MLRINVPDNDEVFGIYDLRTKQMKFLNIESI